MKKISSVPNLLSKLAPYHMTAYLNGFVVETTVSVSPEQMDGFLRHLASHGINFATSKVLVESISLSAQGECSFRLPNGATPKNHTYTLSSDQAYRFGGGGFNVFVNMDMFSRFFHVSPNAKMTLVGDAEIKRRLSSGLKSLDVEFIQGDPRKAVVIRAPEHESIRMINLNTIAPTITGSLPNHSFLHTPGHMSIHNEPADSSIFCEVISSKRADQVVHWVIGSVQIAQIQKKGLGIFEEFFKRVDVLYLNASEAELIMKSVYPHLSGLNTNPNTDRALVLSSYAHAFLDLGVKKVFITDGCHPTTAASLCDQHRQIISVPLLDEAERLTLRHLVKDKQNTADEIGCGDSFSSMVIFMHRLEEAFSLEAYVHMGHLVAGMMYCLPAANFFGLAPEIQDGVGAFLRDALSKVVSSLGGAPSVARTPGPLIKSQLLYQLS